MSPTVDTNSGNINVQLPLGIALNDSARFENFYSGPNRELTQALDRCVEGKEQGPVFFWGVQDQGKTHLLQAVCHGAGQKGRPVAYVPLGRNKDVSPGILGGLEQLTLVCVDDVQAIAGMADWEEALFHLFNRLRDRGVAFIAAADCAPPELGLQLKDLGSRLGWGLVYPMQPLDDPERLELLELRARGRGLELPKETGQFLLSRYPRDLTTLCGLLDQLDQASLAAQRRLTIPFVKSVLART